METVCLEDICNERLKSKGWSAEARTRITNHWADTTKRTYETMLLKYNNFCQSKEVPFPSQDSGILADFLCTIANSSDRPESQLNVASAAIGAYFTCLGLPNPINEDHDLIMLKDALIKSGTKVARTRSKVMPITPFVKMFKSWGENQSLTTSQLRMKAIVLLALVMMLCPSDIATHARLYSLDNGNFVSSVLSTDQVEFHSDGTMTVTLLGIKNDKDRQGFAVPVAANLDPVLDPVRTLKDYISRTTPQRRFANGNPLFLTTVRPFKAICSTTVSRILNDSIKLAGLTGYTAKSFRPTGATVAIENKYDPDRVRQIGRWKTKETFEQHYVHCKAPVDFSSKLLQ